MNNVKFDLGGGFLLSIADIILPVIKGFFKDPIVNLVRQQISNGIPTSFNNFVKNSKGFFNLGENISGFESSPYGSLTLDYQLDDDLRVKKERIEFGFNGTVFNKDKGYRVPENIKQPQMPMYDKNIDSKFQLFISNYLLDTFAAAFLEKQPFKYELQAAKLNNPIAPFTTTTFEGVFPYLTSRFGKDIPTDLMLKVKKIYDIEAFADDQDNDEDDITSKGVLKLKIDLECEGKLAYPGGLNKTVGYAEWNEAILKVNITQANGTVFKIVMQSGNVTT